MTSKKLASAYADAVLDFLETGIPQGVIYKDGLFLLTGRGDCKSTPHLWVDRHWRRLVRGLSVPADPRDPKFNAVRLRAQIIETLAASETPLRLSVGINGSQPKATRSRAASERRRPAAAPRS